MASLRERFNLWMVEMRWRWAETTWRQVIVRSLSWLAVFALLGLGAWSLYSCRGRSDDLTSLTDDLRNSSPNVRARAYGLLAGRDGAAACFAHALRDDRPEIRSEAARALADYPYSTADAVPALIDALSDADPEIRCRAAMALGKAGDRAEEAALALHTAAEDDPNPYVREWAEVALHQLGMK